MRMVTMRIARRFSAIPLLAGAIGSTFASAAAPPAPAEGPTIAIEKFAFAPRELTVAPGTQVVWTNHDETPHTIAAQDGGFVSKAMDTDDRYAYTFERAGDYAYFCTLHPFMTGVVHVRGDGGSMSSKGTP